MQLLPWLDHAIGGVADFAKGAVNNVEHAVGARPTFATPAQRPQQAPVVNRPQPTQQAAPPISLIPTINQATGFNGTPFRPPAPIVAQPVVAPKINMPLETAKQAVVGSAAAIGGFGQQLARIPETALRSVAQTGASAVDESNRTDQMGNNTGLRGILYGKDPIHTYQTQADEVGKTYQNIQANSSIPLPKVDPKYAPFLAPILAGLDLAGGGKKTLVEDFAKAASKDAVKTIAEKNGMKLTEEGANLLANTTKTNDIKSILNAHSTPIAGSVTPEAVKAVAPEVPASPAGEDSIKLYRGGKDISSSFSTDKGVAADYAKNRGGDVTEHTIPSSAKIADYSNFPGAKYADFNDYTMAKHIIPTGKSTLDFMETTLEKEYAKAAKWAKANGYDAIKYPTEGEIRVLNSKIVKTKPAEAVAAKVEEAPKVEAPTVLQDEAGKLNLGADVGKEKPSNPYPIGSLRHELFNTMHDRPEADLGREAANWRSNNSKGFMSDKSLTKAVSDVKAHGADVPSAAPVVATGENGGKLVPNKFTESVKTSPEVSDEVKAMVSGEHEVRNTENLIKQVQGEIKQSLDKTTSNVLKELSVENGKASDTSLARAIEVAKSHDELGTKEGQDMAAAILDQVAEHGVAAGRAVQILSMIARRSPVGLRNKAFRDLKKAGVELTPKLKDEIQGHINTIKGMEDGKLKDFQIAVLQKAIAKHVPQSKIDQAVSLWKADLLSGVKTQQGNAISNATLFIMKKIADVPATVIDQIISVGTHQRTKTLTFRGLLSGTGEGFKNGWQTLRTGIDMRGIGDKFEQHAEINLGNKIFQKVLGDPANIVFRGMNAADQPFWYSNLKNSLYDLAKADGLNKGLRGRQLLDHMNKTVQNPPEEMLRVATTEANKSTLAFDTIAFKGVSAIHKGIEQMPGVPDATKKLAIAATNVLAPFTRVPTAFLSRTVDFTPLGIGREMFEQIASGKFNQRKLSQAIGEGLTGTGVIVLGINLTQQGKLSGDYPKNDAKEQARWKAEHITPNSIRMDNGKDGNGNPKYKWISLNYLGSVGLLFNAGMNYQHAVASGGNGAEGVGQAIAGLGQGLFNQSFVQGMSNFSDAVKDPARFGSKFVNQTAGSIIPSIINDIAAATDPMQREVKTAGEAIQGRIPGARQGLPAKMDVFGNDLGVAGGTQLETLDAFKPSNDNHNPLLNELDRLQQAGKDTTIFPTPDKNITVDKQTIKLTEAQTHEFNKSWGQAVQKTWNEVVASPEYAKLSDLEKKQTLERAMVSIKRIETIKQLQNMGDNSNADKLVKNLKSVDLLTGEGKMTPADWANVASKKAGNPKQNYEASLLKYQNDKKAGKLNTVQDFQAQQSLAKEKVSSNYSQDVVGYHNLSQSQQYALYKQNPSAAQALYNQARSYNQALVDAGLAPEKSGKHYAAGAPTAPKVRGSRGGRGVASRNAASVRSFNSNATRLNKKLASHVMTSKAIKVPKIPSKVARVNIKRPGAIRVRNVA